ncbi:DUF4124 domain-containing protein [Marilutibacter chinensis]|uniref:DUF4124 domain-containing protein n=1 Tax=Marilutibacter chinensis TaxID=2912247 RepID=UPI003CCD4DDE
MELFMRWMLTVGLLMLTFPVAAQQVHKCVSHDGSVSYQSAPCPATSRQERSWDAKPEPPPTHEETRLREQRRRHSEADSLYLSRLAGSRRSSSYAQGAAISSSARSNRRRCEQTKRRRDAAYERLGLNRTFDQSSSWDEAVREACR